MDIDTSFYNNYLNSIKENNLENSTADKLKNSLKSTDGSASDEELMEVCKEFEAYFVEQMFKAMEKTVPQSAMGYNSGDQLTDFFKDNVRQELSKKAADQSELGLAQMLYEQMKRNNDETALG